MKLVGPAFLALFALPLAMLVSVSQAAEKVLGGFQSWEAYSFMENGNTVCVAWAQPQKSEGDYTRRGAVNLFVSHRTFTNPRRLNEVSFEAGYPFAPESAVVAIIDGTRFEMFTQGGSAWNRTVEEDVRMVKAMRAGNTLIVEGTSARGTRTTDRFSLLGFTAAHETANKACKVPSP